MHAPLFANSPTALGPEAAAGRVPAALEAEVRRIYARSPLYGERFPLHAAALAWSCFREIPVLSKQEIVRRGHQAFFRDYAEIERGLQQRRYEYESTGGTTQSPMTVIMEEGWWNAQTARAYAASPILREFAGRPYRKCVLAPVGCSSNLCPYEDHPFPHRYFDGTVYLNLSSDPFAFPEGEWDRIVRELQATRPEVLEGEPVYLSLLARAARRRGVSVPSLRAVILTYGKASRQHGRRIAEVFSAPQADLYGSTEAGYLFVGEAFRDDARVIDANAFIELVPWRPGLPDVYQIHVTTRDREAMPLLRYHTGDIVQRFPAGYRLLGRGQPALPRGWHAGVAGGRRRGPAGRLRLLALLARADRGLAVGFPLRGRRDGGPRVRRGGAGGPARRGDARAGVPPAHAGARGERQVRAAAAPGALSQRRPLRLPCAAAPFSGGVGTFTRGR